MTLRKAVGSCARYSRTTSLSSVEPNYSRSLGLDEHITLYSLQNHAVSHGEKTSTPLQGAEAWLQDHSTLPWLTRYSHDEDILELRYPDSAIGANIARIATGKKTMASDLVSQCGESGRRHSYVPDALFQTEEREAMEGQARVHAPSPTRELHVPKHWKQLYVKQWNLQDLRVSYEEQRERMRRVQQEMHATDAQFIRKARIIESIAIDDMKDLAVEMLENWEALQQARSAVAVEEAKYEKIDGMLVNCQREVRDLESRMYLSTRTESLGASEHQHDFLLAAEDLTESVISSQNIRRNMSLEAQTYRSQLADVENLTEQLMDLQVYQDEVTREQVNREDVGVDPDEELTAFLDSFAQRHEALCLQLRDAKKKLAECEDALQMLGDNNSPFEGQARAHFPFSYDDYFDASALEANMDDDRLAATARAFLFSPEDNSSVYRLLENEPENLPVKKALFINSWLVHHLRTSIGEVERLITVLTNHGLQLEPDDFKEQILANWLLDETVNAFDFPSFAIDSHDYSMATVSGNDKNIRPASENAPQGDQLNNFTLQRRRSARHTQTEP